MVVRRVRNWSAPPSPRYNPNSAIGQFLEADTAGRERDRERDQHYFNMQERSLLMQQETLQLQRELLSLLRESIIALKDYIKK